MKRVLSLFLSCIFVLGVCFSTPIVASATGGDATEPETLVGTEFGETSRYEILSVAEGDTQGTCALIKYGGTETNTTISGSVLYEDVPYTITQISTGAFSENSTVREITISAAVTRIEDGAFDDCVNLASIVYAGHNIEWENVFEGELTGNINVTKNAENCSGEEIVYVADGNKITVKCNGCSEKFGAITLEDPELPEGAESLIYDGAAKEAIVKVEGITGLEEIPAISYVDERSNPITPINTGTYTATFTIGNETAKKEFTIEPKVVSATLGYGGEQQGGLVYNGKEHFLTVFFGEEQLFEGDHYTIEYLNNKDAGEITATVKLTEGGNYAFLDGETLTYSQTINSGINIEKVTPEVTIVKAENLVFTNEEQPLLTTANTTFGTLKFSLENTEDETKWSTDIPKASAVGTHTVYYKVVGDSNVNDLAQQSVEVTISAHNHLWSYEADEETDTITATCEGAGSCNYKTEGVTITLEAPEIPDDATSLIYDGSVKEATVTISAENTGITPDVVYTSETEGVQLVEGKCINAGDYTASITLLGEDGKEAKVTVPFTIEKATPTFIAPTAKTGLVYDGEEQELIENGTTTGGTMQYKLGEDGQWNENIPKAVNAGTYTVYYKVTGNENYNGVVESSVEVTIAPKTITATLTQDSGVYNGSAHEPTVKIDDLCESENLVKDTDYTVNYANNTNVGSATVTVALKNTEKTKNYTFVDEKGANTTTATLTYEITEGVASVETAPTANTLTYNGGKQELVTAGEATNGTMQYRLSENESWSPAIPTAINAGTYKVYYKAAGDENYSDSDVASVDVAIAKATPTTENFKIDLPTNLIFNGDPKTVTVTCGADIGDVTVEYYSGETKLESAPVEVGTYTVKINVAASDNYDAANGITSDDWEFAITECTKHEWKNSKCTICKIDCEHKYEDGDSAISNKVTTQATCVEEGVLLSQCKICDYEEETPLDIVADAHKMSDWNEIVKATCSSTGTEERVCELGCGHKETRSTEKDPDNHTYGDWVITAATCVADGVKVKTCTNTECKHELKETIAKDPTAHKMATEWEVTKEPTCVETGLQVKACLNAGCDHEVEEVIAIKADAHNLGGWVVTKAAKCTVAGEITRFCKNGNCEYKVTDSLDADGKTHSFAQDFTTIEATCITAGSKFKACENEGCKEVAEKTEIAINPDAHKNVETINVKQPTCEEKGYTGDEFCNDCKKTFEPGIEVDALGHTESDWIVDKEATFTEDGARHTACTVCNKELKKEVIAKRVLETPVVKIENAGSGIKVSWSQDEDATGYTVYRSEYNPSTKKWSKWKNRGTAAATKKNWTDKTVKEGVTYRFTVRSVNGDIKSAYKATSGILYVVAPKVTVSISSTGLLAKWNKINNATSYIVYRAELGTDGNWGKWVQLGTTKAEKNTWSDDKVKSGVTYKYTVRAVVGKVKSGYTGSSAIVYLEQPLLKIANAANGITGKWEQVAGATGYTIYRSEYNPSTKKWTKWLNLGTTKATAKSFTDKTAKSGYQYKYTIRAVNGKLKSTYQDSNKLVCLAQPTLKISNVANGIQGKWTKVDGATGYIIYRSELKDGKWTKWVSLGTAKSTAKSFTDKTVKSGVQYKYTIRAKNGSSKSSYIDSNTSIFLSVPTVKIANAATGVKVTWGKIEGAKNYLVYRSEYNSSTKKWSKWKTLETVDTTSFVDETAVSNVKYKYTVRALIGEFRSYYTASAELLYLKAPTVTAEKEDEAIKVSWTKVDGAKSYIIYRSELSKDGKWSKWIKLGTAGEKYTSCKDKTVKEDVTYKYTVRAVNGKLMGYYVASEQILNGVVTESTPENPKTDIVA